MNVSLTPELDRWIEECVSSGLYGSASEVVYEALRLLRAQEEQRQLRREELRSALRAGIDASDAGRVHTADDALFDGIVAEGTAAHSAKGPA